MNKFTTVLLMLLPLLIAGCTSIDEYSYTSEPNTSEIKTSVYGSDYPEEIIEVSSGATGSYSESGYLQEYRWY